MLATCGRAVGTACIKTLLSSALGYPQRRWMLVALATSSCTLHMVMLLLLLLWPLLP